jgi:hypothetical protein
VWAPRAPREEVIVGEEEIGGRLMGEELIACLLVIKHATFLDRTITRFGG